MDDEFHDAALLRVNEAIPERIARHLLQALSRLCEVFEGLYPQGMTVRQSRKKYRILAPSSALATDEVGTPIAILSGRITRMKMSRL